ncbi:peptidylprolyl isomerase FKBP-type [Gemmatirosa kalamazoonensis]|uniref:Peptidyl-prolyl cis-trans isomerase n=1 Tax=Gemmatirosa kalamazoonensis TaxID=861299 RepID=W0RCK2_9BACT|nr:FKBP-type peptidyl-prolyl cis-trans isomerase [Gemmatirosa kalamazoonensis]AHG88050.1 peptidylprolyl isomerase FKBP-type [Gemmatirosa kalamazoonensis]
MLLVFTLACTSEGGDSAKTPPPPGNPDPTQNTYAPQLGVALPAFYKTQRGTYYQDVAVGTGIASIPGRKVKVRYTGWLPNGTKFDAGEIDFTPGAGEVIVGWDDGIVGMKVGGKRKLVIPASLGYGAQGAPPDIPPNSVLVFDVELLSVA